MPQIGYRHTLRELETAQDAEQSIRRALLETKQVMERKKADHDRSRVASLAAVARLRETATEAEKLELNRTEAALKKPHPWQGKTVRFTGEPHIETTVVPDGEVKQADGTMKPQLRTTVTGTWDYEVV